MRLHVPEPQLYAVTVRRDDRGNVDVTIAPSASVFVRDAEGHLWYIGPVARGQARLVRRLGRRGWTDAEVALFLRYSPALVKALHCGAAWAHMQSRRRR